MPIHDPVAARAALDGFQNAIARASEPAPPPPPTNPPGTGSLSRRTPGASLAPGLRDKSTVRSTVQAPRRDPDAERATFDAFAAGFARAAAQTGPIEVDFPGTPKEGS
jgi:hypothetical protein